jgi:DNA-binding response OmpR family regulator
MKAPQHLRILVIDDDPRLPEALSESLSQHGYTVLTAATEEDARRLLDESAFDALVATREQVATSLLETIRHLAHRPAVLTAGAGESMAELDARIVAAVRRQRPAPVDHFSFGPYQLNISKRRLYCDHAEVRITRSEYLLLRTLAMNRGVVVSRRQLMQAVWGTATMSHGALDTLVNTVRQKLNDFHPGRISPVLGTGYTLLEESVVQKQSGHDRHPRKQRLKS